MAPMCLTIVYCLMASLFIAMTVVPASASTILRNAKPKEHRIFDKIQDAYGAALGFCLKRKWIPITAAVVLLAVFQLQAFYPLFVWGDVPTPVVSQG